MLWGLSSAASWPGPFQSITKVNQGWGASHTSPHVGLRRRLHAASICMIVPWGRYYLTHFRVKKNGRLNKWSNFSKITDLLMGRDAIWIQVYLIPTSMLFLLLWTVFLLCPIKRWLLITLLLFHTFSFSSETDNLLFCTKSFLQVLFIEDSWSLLSDSQGGHMLGSSAWDAGLVLFLESIGKWTGSPRVSCKQKKGIYFHGVIEA